MRFVLLLPAGAFGLPTCPALGDPWESWTHLSRRINTHCSLRVFQYKYRNMALGVAAWSTYEYRL